MTRDVSANSLLASLVLLLALVATLAHVQASQQPTDVQLAWSADQRSLVLAWSQQSAADRVIVERCGRGACVPVLIDDSQAGAHQVTDAGAAVADRYFVIEFTLAGDQIDVQTFGPYVAPAHQVLMPIGLR